MPKPTTTTTDSKVTGWLDLVIKSVVGWINKVFLFFGQYSSTYAKPILILIGLWLLSKILKIHIGTGGKHR